MATVIVHDVTRVVVPVRAVVALLSESVRWQALWPGSQAVVVAQDAPGRLGWTLTGVLVGESWITVAESEDGVRVEYRLEADPAQPGAPATPRQLPDSPHGRREVAGLQERHLLSWKRSIWALSAQYERVLAG